MPQSFGRLVFAIVLTLHAQAQPPSQEEQQYLFSVLPLIDHCEIQRAQEQLLKGLDQFLRSAILYNALGIVYRKQGNIESVVRSFQKALDILPSFTAAHLQLAAIDQQRGNKVEAAKWFRLAAESTTNFDALMAAGLGLADCEDYPSAVHVLGKARAARPDSAAVTYNLALAQYKAGNPRAAWASTFTE